MKRSVLAFAQKNPIAGRQRALAAVPALTGRTSRAVIVALPSLLSNATPRPIEPAPEPALEQVPELVEQAPEPAEQPKPIGRERPKAEDVTDKVSTTIHWPMKPLSDGRKPRITSGHHSRNSSRSSHQGVDIFWRYIDSDPLVAKDRRVIRKGKRRWWIPDGAVAVAVGDGTVLDADPDHGTGGKVWLQVGDMRFGYFHLSKLLVRENQTVQAGDSIGEIGANPKDSALVHLHFEVSIVGKYRPQDPEDWLEVAKHWPVE